MHTLKKALLPAAIVAAGSLLLGCEADNQASPGLDNVLVEAAQRELAKHALADDIVVSGVSEPRLLKLRMISTNKGTLIADLGAGIVVNGALEDMQTGEPVFTEPTRRASPLPFANTGAGGAKSDDSDVHPFIDGLDPGMPAEKVGEAWGKDIVEWTDRLSQQLGKRLLEIKARASGEGGSAAEASSGTVLPPAGAVPKIGFDNSGRALSEEQKRVQVQGLMKSLPDNWMVSWKAPEETSAITVLTDPTCPFCQRLHRAIPELNEAGITVNYLFFPRHLSLGAGDSRARQSVSRINAAFCADDPHAAMDELFAGGSPGRPCSALPESDERPRDPAADHYQLGLIMGVEATPHIIHSSGNTTQGFSNARALIDRIHSFERSL